MNPSVSTLLEIPEPLNDAIAQFISNNPQWNEERIAIAALCLFLMKNGFTNLSISRLYLDTLHQEEHK